MKKTIILCALILGFSCKKDKPEKSTNDIVEDYSMIKISGDRPNLNISILLDLSDRINPEKYPNPAMDYYRRDVGYINSITQAFEIHLRNKQSIRINDKIQLFLDPEPFDKDLNEKIEKLKMSFTKNNATRELIMQTSKDYDSISTLLYETAINDDKYVGSDTWRFFKNKVKDYCIDENARNILIILTDGYLFHKDTKIMSENRTSYIRPQDIRDFKLTNNDWKDKFTNEDFGFIPVDIDLSKLEILVLGINPDKKNQYEEDVILKYWNEWFDSMSVKKYEIKITDLPSNIDKIIKDFILYE